MKTKALTNQERKQIDSAWLKYTNTDDKIEAWKTYINLLQFMNIVATLAGYRKRLDNV